MSEKLEEYLRILPFSGLSIKVQPRTHYGTERLYPVGQLSKDLISLAGRKTWTNELLDKFKALGIEIEYIPSNVEID